MSATPDGRRLIEAIRELNNALAEFTDDDLARIYLAGSREMRKRGLTPPGPSVIPTPDGPGPEQWEMR